MMVKQIMEAYPHSKTIQQQGNSALIFLSSGGL